jgi:hypothetical protein
VALEWLPGAAIALAGGGLSWWKATDIARIELAKNVEITKVQIENSIEKIKSDLLYSSRANERTDDEFKRDLYSAVADLRAVTLTIAKLTSGQDVINAMTAKAMESYARKQEEQERAISDIKASVAVMSEWLKRMEERG